jgi:hypothetical protein
MTTSSEAMNAKRTLIANFPTINWKSRLAVFLGVFGFFWLFLEPLSAFKLGESVMSTLGIWGYLSLFVVSAVLTIGYELFQRRKQIGKMDLIPITLVLTETGTRHYLNTPRDIKSGIFIKRFVETLQHIPESSVLSHPEMYDLSLLVMLKQKVVELDPKLAFAESSIDLDGELECRIFGRIKPEYETGQAMANRIARPVEIVICLDVTGSMQGTIDDLKANLLSLHENIANEYKRRGITIYDIGIKIVAFRDFYVDGDAAAHITPFFNLPNENVRYRAAVTSLVADGGGDSPETSLEALALGIMSEWDRSGDKNQLVVLITDAPPHPLDKRMGNKPENYPKNIPPTLDAMKELWESGQYIKNSGKKLLLVAPIADSQIWEDISNTWTMVWCVDFKQIVSRSESVSTHITKLVADSMIDTERAA